MAGEDIIMMSQKELSRLHLIRKVLEKKLKQVNAANILRLSTRQIRRIIKRVRKEGDKAIVHKSRGRPSNRKLPEKLKDRAIKLYRDKYQGFGPTLAVEELEETDKIKLSDETLRLWLIAEGQWKKSRKSRKHRAWRERKHHFGEMLQLDGSHHDWLEARAPECVLMGYIDDATNTVFARFYTYEGTFPAMDSFKRYINKHGLPQSIYLDKHTTYKSTAKPTIEDELNNTKPLSQFERALNELGVEVIHAQSPQAKGRVERLFGTFQDRLIKKMRLEKIKTVDQANRFLKHYLPKHNKRFRVSALEKADLHRALPQNINLDKILCIKTEHPLRNDFTAAHNKKLYQILQPTTAKKVTVEERINGTMFITYKGKPLKYKQIAKKPAQAKPEPKIKKPFIPPKDHPYKSFKVSPYTYIHSYPQKEESGKEEKELLQVH